MEGQRFSATDGFWLALVLAVFAPAWLAMSEIWRSVDYYSHGFLVPVVAFWAASGHWPRLRTLPAAPDARGLVGLAAAVGLFALGVGIGSVPTQGVALVAALAACVAYRRGFAWLRGLAFPLAFLLFMVPLPPEWVTPVIVRLQLFVSSVGVALVRALGFSVYRDGNVIHLAGGESLFVAEACSGITSLITLLPLAVFLAYFTERQTWRRLTLVAAVLPLAMLGNLARVVGTVIAAERYGTDVATTGPAHEWAGVATYVLGCLALLGLGALMRRWVPEPISPASS